MSRELLERALRALNNPQDCGYFGALITEIKAELAKPEQAMKRLSDEEISKFFYGPIQNLGTAIVFAKAIQNALIEKNK